MSLATRLVIDLSANRYRTTFTQNRYTFWPVRNVNHCSRTIPGLLLFLCPLPLFPMFTAEKSAAKLQTCSPAPRSQPNGCQLHPDCILLPCLSQALQATSWPFMSSSHTFIVQATYLNACDTIPSARYYCSERSHGKLCIQRTPYNIALPMEYTIRQRSTTTETP